MTSPVAHDPRFMLRAALAGFDGARDRFHVAAVPGARPELVFVPLAEALWWAVSVDDGFKELAERQGLGWANKGAYRNDRDNDPDGRVLEGVRYARDRCGHQLALAALEGELTLPFHLPNTLGPAFRWRPSDQFPQPTDKNAFANAEKKRPCYDTWLAKRPASMAVESAAKWFAHAVSKSGI
jgi:hypothetical protein